MQLKMITQREFYLTGNLFVTCISFEALNGNTAVNYLVMNMNYNSTSSVVLFAQGRDDHSEECLPGHLDIRGEDLRSKLGGYTKNASSLSLVEKVSDHIP